MASPTYLELMNELLPLYEAQPSRFMRFYNAVWLMLYQLGEGEKLVIAERCRQSDRELFFKVASLIMISDNAGRRYHFYDESMTIIQRECPWRPSNIHPKNPFYDKKRT